MDRKFEYRGDLAVTPLAEILATIHRYRVPGVISVAREGRLRKIFLDEGVVVFATSNEKEVSLAMCLLKEGILTPDTAREADARRTREGLRLGQVLLQMGILTPEGLNDAIARQVRGILWGAFDWETGEVLFEIGIRPDGPVRIDLPIPKVILEGIRRCSDVRRLAQRLGTATTILQKTQGPLIGLFAEREEAYYERVDGKTPLQQLSANGPGSISENARLLYAFYCLGLLTKMHGTGIGAKRIQYKTEGGSLV